MAFKSMYGRKTITYNYDPPERIIRQAGEQVFRGFLGGEAFTTKKGYKGMRIDSLWSQHMFAAFETDDADLAEIALQSSLADIHETVRGGEYGSAYSIGDYGFYAEEQFEEQAQHLHQVERENASKEYFLSQDEWAKIDAYLSTVARHSKACIAKACRGDSFAALAIRKDAYQVAILLLEKGIDPLAVNELDQDIVDIAQEQYAIVSQRLKVLTTKQTVYYHQTKTKNEIESLRQEQQQLSTAFQGMIDFVLVCQQVLEVKLTEIEADLALKRQCELLHRPFPKEKEFNITRKEKGVQHRHDLSELLQYAQQKLDMCTQSFQEFEIKLKAFQEKKLGRAKAIQIQQEQKLALAALEEERMLRETTAVALSMDEEEKKENDIQKDSMVENKDREGNFTARLPSSRLLTSRTSQSEEDYFLLESSQRQREKNILVKTEDTVILYK